LEKWQKRGALQIAAIAQNCKKRYPKVLLIFAAGNPPEGQQLL
jgi:hypothetical protein